jgi:hypothetical protein
MTTRSKEKETNGFPKNKYLEEEQAKLEDCDRRSVQGQRVRVWQKAALSEPGSQSFSSAEVFLLSDESAGSMTQRAYLTSQHAVPRLPALRAVVR